MSSRYDAIIVGSGPNGLAAASVLAHAGFSVLVREEQQTLGGGARTGALTLPGFLHDFCSAVHPLGISSPYLKTLPLESHGLEWIFPPAPLAHPFDHAPPVLVERSLEDTASHLEFDARGYRNLYQPLVQNWDIFTQDALAPLHLPRHLPLMARFGMSALRSAQAVADHFFEDMPARALFAGHAAHSIMPLEKPPTAAIALVLGAAAHARGWPLARGGSQAIVNALVKLLTTLGVEFKTEAPVTSLKDLPEARVILFDLTPQQILKICAEELSISMRSSFEAYRYGPGVFKMDWALKGPLPWRHSECARAGTVHLGGSFEEIALALRQVWNGKIPDRPFVLLSQPSLFDPTRAPQGCHTLWAYCHVPHGSRVDMSDRIEAQIERFAPGFKNLILARALSSPANLEKRNANLVGGDITGGVADLRQLLFRPRLTLNPYALEVARGKTRLFICSSSTPPGAGVHGMCGYFAAKNALKALS